MKLNMLIIISVVALSSCAELSSQPNAADVNLKKLNCQGMPNPQRNECLSDISPEYDKYQEDRKKLLQERTN